MNRKKLAEAPAIEEDEIILPQLVGSDHRVRIPPEMMPNDDQALQYFEYFFSNIHPYVPVLNRASFYEQWNRNRSSISPLILEAIFACSSLILEEPSVGAKWLALAASKCLDTMKWDFTDSSRT